MARAAKNGELGTAFREHLEQTKGQAARLVEILKTACFPCTSFSQRSSRAKLSAQSSHTGFDSRSSFEGALVKEQIRDAENERRARGDQGVVQNIRSRDFYSVITNGIYSRSNVEPLV
jgi:hypothetical protein